MAGYLLIIYFDYTGQDFDIERLNKLATFQKKALQHALSCKLIPFLHVDVFFFFK